MITQEEKVDQVRSVTLDCQWGTGERLRLANKQIAYWLKWGSVWAR
ncbi:hypothetical protein [Vibrio anguillarum]|nr:hypothetical protein [Vibrio anguillarum]